MPVLSAALKPTSAELLWITDIYGFLEAGLLIVMGSLGRHGLDRLMMGDIVSKVIQHARTQVLIVPADRTYLQQIINRANVNQYA